jgi:hypothetical protein
MERSDDSFRMNPVSLGALIGAVFTFFVIGAIVDVIWVAIGGFVGAGVGWVVRRYARDARAFKETVDLTESATKSDLYDEAQKLDIPGRSTMTRDELAAAVAERRQR